MARMVKRLDKETTKSYQKIFKKLWPEIKRSVWANPK